MSTHRPHPTPRHLPRKHRKVLRRPPQRALHAVLDHDQFGLAAEDEALVIGGAEVYAQVLPLVSRMYITEVETSVDGDAFFPAFDPAGWQEVSRERHHDEASDLHYSFVVYDRPDS